MSIKEIKEFNQDPHVCNSDDKDNCEESSVKNIKQELFDSCHGNEQGLSGQEWEVGGCNEIMSQDSSFKEEFGEVLMKEEIKEEFMEDQSSPHHENEERQNSQDENSIENCLQRKMDSPASNLDVGSSQAESVALFPDSAGVLKKKSQTVQKLFKCSSCPYQTAQRSHLQEHERRHTGEKPFKCSSCPYQAVQWGQIQRHMRIHTGTKPFKCNSCSYQAQQWGQIQRHMRIHTGEKPFKCNSCSYQAAEIGNLKVHERTHSM